jgi:predicted DNA-binding transcriptional regulator AlpA
MDRLIYLKEELPLILNADHIAQVLGVSRTVAYGLMKTEGFPSIKLNAKRIVAPRDRFLRWVDELADRK